MINFDVCFHIHWGSILIILCFFIHPATFHLARGHRTATDLHFLPSHCAKTGASVAFPRYGMIWIVCLCETQTVKPQNWRVPDFRVLRILGSYWSYHVISCHIIRHSDAQRKLLTHQSGRYTISAIGWVCECYLLLGSHGNFQWLLIDNVELPSGILT